MKSALIYKRPLISFKNNQLLMEFNLKRILAFESVTNIRYGVLYTTLSRKIIKYENS